MLLEFGRITHKHHYNLIMNPNYYGLLFDQIIMSKTMVKIFGYERAAIVMWLIENSGRQNNGDFVIVKHELVSEELFMDKRSFRRHLTKLHEIGILDREYRNAPRRSYYKINYHNLVDKINNGVE